MPSRNLEQKGIKTYKPRDQARKPTQGHVDAAGVRCVGIQSRKKLLAQSWHLLASDRAFDRYICVVSELKTASTQSPTQMGKEWNFVFLAAYSKHA